MSSMLNNYLEVQITRNWSGNDLQINFEMHYFTLKNVLEMMEELISLTKGDCFQHLLIYFIVFLEHLLAPQIQSFCF